MTQLYNPFNPAEHDTKQGGDFKQLPLGRHKVIIESSEIKQTSAGDGGYLQLNLKIIEGPEQGVEGPFRLNLYNDNVKTVAIANTQLTCICHVTGQFQLGPAGTDVTVLYNIPFCVEVKNQGLTQDQKMKQAAGENVTPFTDVKKVFDINGNVPGTAAQTQQQPPVQQPPVQQAPEQPPQQQNWNQQPPQAAANNGDGGKPPWVK